MWHCCGRRRCSETLKLEGDEQIGVNIIDPRDRGADALDRDQRRPRGLDCRAAREGHEGRSEGFNAQTEHYENLVQAGVIDPTKVVRSALQNAASIASLLLTTEAVISHIPEERKSARCLAAAIWVVCIRGRHLIGRQLRNAARAVSRRHTIDADESSG